MGSRELIALARALDSEGDREVKWGLAGSLGVEPRFPQGNKGRGWGGDTGMVGVFREELSRIGSWGQCSEPTCWFQSQFYSLSCDLVRPGLSVSI